MIARQTDIAILGGGPGGYVAAIRAAQLGYEVTLIENESLGGVCLNWGCIPSKSLLHSAKLYQQVLHMDRFGITGIDKKQIQPDWQKMVQNTGRTVKRLTGGVQALLNANKIEFIKGFGRVTSKATLVVENTDTQIHFKQLIIATGSHYEQPNFATDKDLFKTPKTIYNIPKIPSSITIIGAGVVGTEFAILFASLGSKVTLVDKLKRPMPYLDQDLKEALLKQLKKLRVNTIFGVSEIDYKTNELQLTTDGKELQNISSEIYLLANRRHANLEGLDVLLDSGMELRGGYIRTDARSQTNLANIYAIGDVNGRFMLAHVASKEGQTAVETIHGIGRDLLYDFMPYNLYGLPEVASVGLTEQQAAAKGFIYKTGKFPLSANGKALIENDYDGFIKIIYDTKYGEILGVHIVAPNATDLISESVLAMQSESTIWDLASSVHPHPTMSETLMEASFKSLERPIHTL